jgi:hypothetical protein
VPHVLEGLDAAFDQLVSIDFETYYSTDYGLRKLTTEAYVRDPRFEVIGVGVKVNDGPTVWLEERDFRAWAARVDWSRTAVLAHHAHFDGLILSHHYGIRPAVWLDTLSMARALHGTEVGGSLEKLMLHYRVGVKGKEVLNAKGKRRADFTPAEYEAYGQYCCNDVDGCVDIFAAMVAEGFPEVELWNIDTTVRMFTEPTFVLDEPLLQRFLVDERRRKADLLERVAKDKSILLSNDKFAALLVSLGVEPPMKISPQKSKTAGHPVETFAFAKTDPGMQALLEHDEDEIRWLAEARIGVKSTINETRTERFLRAGSGGRPVPVYLKYAAAHTFRWGGGDRMNFQNLERTNDKKPEAGALRRALRAPEGKRIVVADSGQIEARVVAWLAGHDTLLDTFRRNDARGARYKAAVAEREVALGREPTKEESKRIDEELAAVGIVDGDVYGEFGTTVFGKPVSKKTPIERHISKGMVLGLGFGMGWFKFSGELLKGLLGAAPIQFRAKDAEQFGVDVGGFEQQYGERVEKMVTRIPYAERVVHCSVAKHFVDLYRTRNKPITDLWRQMEIVLRWMDDGREETFGPGDCLRTVRHGIVLPNGLTMHYPGLGFRRDSEGNNGSWGYMGGRGGKERVKAYGGSITENIVQACARVVVAEQMLKVRTRYHITTMTHDEVVAMVDESQAESALGFTLATMRTPPAWAPGLPLNADGGFGSSYGEVK